MHPFRKKTVFFHLLATALILLSSIRIYEVSAQITASILLTPPDTSTYPFFSTTFKLLTPDGEFIRDAKPQEFVLLENNLPRTIDNLEMLDNGVRFAVAINEGPTMANKDPGTGRSRFDVIKDSLLTWAQTRTELSRDEFSLFTSYGPLNLDANSPQTWIYALESYQPDLRNAEPSLISLTNALQSLFNTQKENSKTGALLFVTPLPTSAEFNELNSLVNQALEKKIPLSIWLVGPTDYSSSEKARQLQQFAESTGGKYFLFSGAEVLPELSDWLDPLSLYYRLDYTSGIKSSGEFSLMVKFTRGNIYLESTSLTISLSVLPPNPIFLSPPANITRSWITDENKVSSLTPLKQKINILVEYPDGMERALTFSRLFVDSKLMDENTSEPFDQFSWDLSSYIQTSEHELQVIVQDIAGITGETIILPVTILVEEKPMGWWEKARAQFTPLSGVIAGLALAMLLSAIIALVRPGKTRHTRRSKDLDSDPLTQPVDIEGEYILPVRSDELQEEWPIILGKGLAPARLIRKSNGFDVSTAQKEIPLSSEELVIGSEGRKADIVLHNPSVSPVHAHIYKDADGDYRVADMASLAGTWVNYAPVSTQGIKLEHGDIVQFGRVGYVFELHGPHPRRLQVLPYQEE